MINLETIRTRCDEYLNAAIAQGDESRIARLQLLAELLAEDDCFSYRKLPRIQSKVIVNLKLTVEEASEFLKYLENRTKAPGVLYVKGSDGREHPVEAMLDTERESYYCFTHGPICKQQFYGDNFYDTYALQDGKWVYDASLERMFIDTGYDYVPLRYEILRDK